MPDFSRIQSPSSIGTFKQCPRKYYCRYILEIPGPANIAQLRGKVVHSVLENFFDSNISELTRDNASLLLTTAAQQLLVEEWKKVESEFDELCPEQDQRMILFEESLLMVQEWVQGFVVNKLLSMEGDILENFRLIIPDREKFFVSKHLGVRGFVDAIEEENGVISIMDYKTSKNNNVNNHKLQLGIYALLFAEQYNRLPDKAGIYFLKHNSRKCIDINDELLDFARLEIAFVHDNTRSKRLADYPMKPGPLCDWGRGRCEFYEYCFEGKELPKIEIQNELSKE